MDRVAVMAIFLGLMASGATFMGFCGLGLALRLHEAWAIPFLALSVVIGVAVGITA